MKAADHAIGAGATARALPVAERRVALGAAWRVLLASRLVVLGVAVFAAVSLEATGNRERFDAPGLTRPFDGLAEQLFSPLAHWDAVWYLSIAWNGYGASGVDAAFFPLYPLLVFVAGAGASPGALLVASYAVSLVAFLGALYLLHRLVELELGRTYARPTLALLAFFPASLFFGAPYSESLFLLVSVGAFYAARTGSWAWAGALAGAASATRSAGILLLVPLLILWWRSPRRSRDVLWLGLAPAGIAAYTAYLWIAQDDPFAYLGLQEAWDRSFAGPLVGAWHGLDAAWEGAGALGEGGGVGELARRNLVDFGFLVFAAVAAAGVWRRLPPAYGAYVTAALLLPLSFPVSGEPLMSLGRFVAVLFPVFMWLAVVCEERRLTDRAVAVSAVLLGLLTTWFATWQWVA
ncbi:MAG: mannosyltransferase family protein [Thermoleophilaceae bacterium]